MFLTLGLSLLYAIIHWNASSPPVNDIISPLVTLSMAAGLILVYGLTLNPDLSTTLLQLICSLIVDSMADYYMNSKNLTVPLALFSTGHIMKQLAFIQDPWSPISMVLLFGSIVAMALLYSGFHVRHLPKLPSSTTRELIHLYCLVIGFSFVNIYLASMLSRGYILFIISDLIIAYELGWGKIYPRQFRVIAVPILYWLAEYIIVVEALL